MTKRIIIGGLIAGVAMVMWGALAHMVLGLGETGIKQISNEATVVSAMQSNIKEAGFYFFPGMEEKPNMTKEEKQASEKKFEGKYLAGPRGILIYHPDGAPVMSPKQLLSQLAIEIVVGLIAAFALAQAAGLKTYPGRVGFVPLLGLFPFIDAEFPCLE